MIRLLLAVSGVLAGALVARDAPIFGVVQAMLAIWVVVVVLLTGAWLSRR
ncbi:hypothetical protein [Belnapia rosea]|nr:hypothetical protein [Belnapia rosea]